MTFLKNLKSSGIGGNSTDGETDRSTKLISPMLIFAFFCLLLLILGFFGPRIYAFYDFATSNGRFFQLFHDELGFGNSAAQLLAPVCSLVSLFASAYAYSWSFLRVLAGLSKFKEFAQGATAFILVSTMPQALTLIIENTAGETCFVQGSGEPRKWYVVDNSGAIILSDNPGRDDRGRLRKKITVSICQAYFDQKSGRFPIQVTYAPDVTVLFDPLTGIPKLWYSVRQKDEIVLFDYPGTDPVTSQLLRPVTIQVEAILRKRAESATIDSVY